MNVLLMFITLNVSVCRLPSSVPVPNYTVWWQRHVCVNNLYSIDRLHGSGTTRWRVHRPNARFPLPELTARVDGWPVSITRQHGPCWRVMETGHPSTRVVETGLNRYTTPHYSRLVENECVVGCYSVHRRRSHPVRVRRSMAWTLTIMWLQNESNS